MIDKSAYLPTLFEDLHSGIILAILAAIGCWWLLSRSTFGFSLKAVGANPHSRARTAGMKIERSYVTVMLICGALAGLVGLLAGARYAARGDPGRRRGVRFRRHHGRPARTWQADGHRARRPVVRRVPRRRARGLTYTNTPSDIVSVIEPVMVLFIAAPSLVRGIFRLKGRGGGSDIGQLAKGWNG